MKKNKKKLFFILGGAFLGLSLVTAIGLHSFNQGVVNNTFSSDLSTFLEENERNLKTLKTLYNNKDDLPYNRKNEFKENENAFFNGEINRSNSSSSSNSSNSSNDINYHPFSINNQKERYKDSHFQYSFNYNSQLTNTFRISFLKDFRVINDLVKTRIIKISNNLKNETKTNLGVLDTLVFKTRLLSELKNIVDNQEQFATIYDDAKKLYTLLNNGENKIFVTELKLHFLRMKTEFEKQILIPFNNLKTRLNNKLNSLPTQSSENKNNFIKFVESFNENYDLILDYIANNIQILTQSKNSDPSSKNGYNEIFNDLNTFQKLPLYSTLDNNPFLTYSDRSSIPRWFKKRVWSNKYDFDVDLSNYLSSPFAFKSPFLVIDNIKFIYSENNTRDLVDSTSTGDNNIHTRNFQELSTLLNTKTTLIGKYDKITNKFIFKHPNDVNRTLFEVQIDQSSLDSLTQSGSYNIQDYELTKPSKVKVYFYRDKNNVDLLDSNKTSGLIKIQDANDEYEGITRDSYTKNPTDINKVLSNNVDNVYFKKQTINDTNAFIDSIKDDYALIWVNNWQKAGAKHQYPWLVGENWELKDVRDRRYGNKLVQSFNYDWMYINNPLHKYFIPLDKDNSDNSNIDYFLPESSLLTNEFNRTTFGDPNNATDWNKIQLTRPDHYPLRLGSGRDSYPRFDLYSNKGGILHDFLDNGFILVKKSTLKETNINKIPKNPVTQRNVPFPTNNYNFSWMDYLTEHIGSETVTKFKDVNVDKYFIDQNKKFNIRFHTDDAKRNANVPSQTDYNVWWFIKHRNNYLQNREQDVNGFYPLYSLPKKPKKDIENEFPTNSTDSNLNMENHRSQIKDIQKQRNLANQEYLEMFEEIVLKNKDEWVSSTTTSIYKDHGTNPAKTYVLPVRKYKTYLDNIPTSIWNSLLKTSQGQKFKESLLNQFKSSTSSTFQQTNIRFVENEGSTTKPILVDNYNNSISHNSPQTRSNSLKKIKYKNYEVSHLLVSSSYFNYESGFVNRLVSLKRVNDSYPIYDYNNLPFDSNTKVVILPMIKNPQTFKVNERNIPDNQKKEIFVDGNAITINNQEWVIVPILYRKEDVLPIEVINENKKIKDIINRSNSDNFLTNIPKENLYEITNNNTRLSWTNPNYYDRKLKKYISKTFDMNEEIRSFLSQFLRLLILRYTDNYLYYYNMSEQDKRRGNAVVNNNSYYDAVVGPELTNYRNSQNSIFKDVYSFMVIGKNLYYNDYNNNPHVLRQIKELDKLVYLGFGVLDFHWREESSNPLRGIQTRIEAFSEKLEEIFNDTRLNTVYSLTLERRNWHGVDRGALENFKPTGITLRHLLGKSPIKEGRNSPNGSLESVLKITNDNLIPILTKIFNKLNVNNNLINNKMDLTSNTTIPSRLFENFNRLKDYFQTIFNNNQNKGYALLQVLFQIAWRPLNNHYGNSEYYDVGGFFGLSDGSGRKWEMHDQMFDLIRYLHYIEPLKTYQSNSTREWNWVFKDNTFTQNLVWRPKDSYINNDYSFDFYHSNKNEYFVKQDSYNFFSIISSRKNQTSNNSFKKIKLVPYYKGAQYYDYSSNKINILNVDKDNTTIVVNGYGNYRFYHLRHGLFYDYINNQQDSSLPIVVPKIFVESYSKVLSWLRTDVMVDFIYERPSNVDNDLSTTEKNRMKEILKSAFSNTMQRSNSDTYRTFENLKIDILNAINQSRILNHPIKLLYYLESGMFFKDFSHNKYINQNILNHWLINGSEIDIEDLKKENWISFKNQNLFTHNLNPNQWFITEDGLYRLEIQRNPLKTLRSIPWSNFVNYSSRNQNNTPKVDIYTQNLDNVVLKDNNLREFIKELNNVVGDKSNITHLNVIDSVKRFVKYNSKIINNKEFDTKLYDIDAFLFNIIKDYFETQLKLHRLVQENIPTDQGNFKRWKFEKIKGVDGLWKESSDSQTILDSFYTPTFYKSTSDVSELLEKSEIVNAYNVINKKYPNKVVRLVLDTFVFNKTTFKTFVNENGTLNSVNGNEVLLSKDDKELHKAFHVFNTYHEYLEKSDKTNINAWMFLFKYIVGLDQISELDNYLLPFYLIEQNNRIGIDLNNFFFYSNEINNNIKNFENIINYGDIRYKKLLNNKRLEWMFDLITKQYPKQYLDHTKKYQLSEIIKKIKSYDVFENFNNEDSKVKLIRNEYKYQFGNKSAKMITISDYGIGMSTQTSIPNKSFETKNQSNEIVHFKPYEQFDYETIINNHLVNNPITSNQIVFLVNEEINTNDWISLYPPSTNFNADSNDREDLPNPSTRLYKSTKTFVVIDLDKVVNFDEYALAFVYQHPTYGELLFTIRFNLETRKHEIIIGDYYKNQLNNEIVNDIVHLDKFVGKFNNYTTSNDPVALNNYELKLDTHFLKDKVNNIYKNSILSNEFNDPNQQMNYVNMEFVLQPNTSNTNLFENYNIWFNNPNNVPNDYFNRYTSKHLSNKQSLNMTESIWYTFSDKKDIIFKPQFDVDTTDYFTHAENQEKNYSVTNNIPLYYYINNRIINLLNLLFDYERMRTYNRVVFKDFVHSYDRRKIKVELDEYLKLLQNTNDPFALIVNKNVKMTIQMLEGVNAITKTENNQTKWLKDINDSDSSMMLNLNSTKSISEVIKTGIVYIYHNSLKINELSKKYRQYTTLEKLTNEQLQSEITRLSEEIKQINTIPNHTPKEIGLLETFLYKIKSTPLNRLIDESHLIVNESNPSNIQLSQTHQNNKELIKIVSSLRTFLQSNKSQSLFFTQEHYDQVSKLLEYYLTLIYQMITNQSFDSVVVNNDKFDILIKNLYDGAIGIKHYEYELNPDQHSEYSYGSFLLTPTHTLEWYNSKMANNKHANNSSVFPKNDANQDFVYKKDITLQYNESTNRIFDINYSRNSTSTPYDKNNPNLRFVNNNRSWNDVKNNNKSNFVYNSAILRPKSSPTIIPFWVDYKNTVLAFLDILENDFYFLDDFLKNPRKFAFNDEFVSGFNLLMLWIMPIIGTNTWNFTTNNFSSDDWKIMNEVKSQLKKFVDSYNYSKQKISNNINSISKDINYNSEPNKKKLNNSMVTNEGLLVFDKNNTQGNIFIFNNNDGFSLFKQDSSSDNVDDSIRLIKSFVNQNYNESNNSNHFNLYFEITKRIIKTIKNKLRTTTRNGSIDEGNTMTTLVSTLQQIMFVYRNVEKIDPWFNQNLDVNHTKETIKAFIESENYKEMNEFLVSMLGWTSYINQSMFKSPIWKPTTFFVGLFSPATAIVRLGMTIADTINKYNNNVELLNQTKNNLKKIIEKIDKLNTMINFENIPFNLQTHMTRFVSKLFNVEYFKKKIENLTKATHWKTVTESFFVDLFAGWYYSIWRNPSFEDQLNFNLNRYHHSQLANMFEYLKTIGIYDHNLIINPNDITLDAVVDAFKKLFQNAVSSSSNDYYKFKVHEKVFVFKHGSTIITYKMLLTKNYNWILQNETPTSLETTKMYYTISPKDLANFPSIKKPTYTNETTDYNTQDKVKVEIIKNKYNATYEQLFKTTNIYGLLKINKSSGN